MIKCFCSDVDTNGLCIKQTQPAALTSKKQNKTATSTPGGFCYTDTFCLSKANWKDNTLGFDYSCDQNTTKTTKSNKCNNKTNIYEPLGRRPLYRMSEYCCSSGDFCNLKFSSKLENYNRFKLLNNTNEIDVNSVGISSKNLNLLLFASLTIILIALTVAILSIVYMFVKKCQWSFISSDVESVNLNQHQSQPLIKTNNEIIDNLNEVIQF